MARFISRSPNFSVGVQSEKREEFADGKHRVVRRGLEAKFQRMLTSDYEKEVGVKTFKFPGVPEDKDTRTDISPLHRISCFDTEYAKNLYEWTDEEVELVLEALRRHPQYGTMLVEVEQPKRPAPWAGYDNLAGERVAAAVQATGVDVREVIAYETENANRESVLADLELLLEDDPAPISVDA